MPENEASKKILKLNESRNFKVVEVVIDTAIKDVGNRNQFEFKLTNKRAKTNLLSKAKREFFS